MSIGYINLEAYILGLIGTSADTDVSTDIANIKSLSDREKAFMGIKGQKGLIDYFNTVGDNAAPDTNIWKVSIVGSSTSITDLRNSIGWLEMITGTAANDGSVVSSGNKRTFSIKDGITTIYFKSRIKINDLTGSFGIGFIKSTALTTNPQDWANGVANSRAAFFYCDNDVVLAQTDDGVGNTQTTDVSTYISTNATWYDIEIRISASNVKFYVDDTLRATHSTRVPSYTWGVNIAVRNRNGINLELDTEHIEAWVE